MSDDWLWDGKGEPDPEEARLASLLGAMRYRGEVPALEARRRRWPLVVTVLGGAAFALAAATVLVVRPVVEPARWSCGEGCSIRVGAWFETGADDVVIEVADIGTMDVSPGSRLRLLATSHTEHRVELAAGQIHASVDAPPRLLVVETPWAAAVDLGCEYHLTVLDDGASLLVVHTGEVSLEAPGRLAYVPMQAAAMSFPGHGPGIPWFADADDAYAPALVALDRDGELHRLDEVLAASRPRDTLSLWHVLQRVPAGRRDDVVVRMIELVPSVGALDRGALLALDPNAIEALRERLAVAWWGGR